MLEETKRSYHQNFAFSDNPGQNIETKYVNPVKLDKTRKPLYLLLRTF